MTKRIVCSHGFGVGADSRGMFPEIEKSLPEYEFTLFDYNEVRGNGDTVVASLDEQAARLQSIIDAIDPTDTIILLCHSQGCIIAGLVDLSHIDQVILLAPPVEMSIQRVINKMLSRPGSEIHPGGMSKLPRTDGTTTYLPSAYLKSVQGRRPLELYQKIANTVPTTIIRATNDEVIGLTNVDTIQNAFHFDIHADHNFSGQHRQALLVAISTVLSNK